MAVLNYRENVDAPWQKLVVSSITMPGEGSLPEEALTVSGDCSYRFAYNGWNWLIEGYGDKITTKDITNCYYMFSDNKLTEIPFELNFKTMSGSSNIDLNSIFYYDVNLKSVPKMNNCRAGEMKYLFGGCENLRELPKDIAEWFDWSYMDTLTSKYSGSRSYQFYNCYSLRSVPMNFLEHGNPVVSYSNSFYNYGFRSCYVLDELIDLPNPHYNATWTSNTFSNTFTGCYRLKNMTFKCPDGNPYVVNWKNQSLYLGGVGYMWSNHRDYALNYNSGITADKEVTDDATYQALKNDKDWFTCDVAYSRYNHDSAVATINSLPDTSAYLATAGGTNTIKFEGAAGSATDGGAINTLTEEEIAVAAAKGWTVSFA